MHGLGRTTAGKGAEGARLQAGLSCCELEGLDACCGGDYDLSLGARDLDQAGHGTALQLNVGAMWEHLLSCSCLRR